MRVSGTVVFPDDAGLKQRPLSERPFLRSNAEVVALFRVQNGEAWFWTWADNVREAGIKRIPF
jgi:hypothetical protein